MQTTLDYISNNNLTCKVCLDGTDTNNVYINSSGIFTLVNLIGNTNYDFIQSNSTLFPSINGNEGLVFNSNQKLYSRNSNLFDNADSYTIINFLTGSTFTSNQLLEGSKSISTSPAGLEYFIETYDIMQQHSRLNIYNTIINNLTYIGLTDSNEVSNIQVFVINHNIKYGITEFSYNQGNYITYLNKDRGSFSTNILNNIYLGNSSSASKPLGNYFRHLLIFIPAIGNTDINNIVTTLLNPNIIWHEISSNQWNSISSLNWNTIIS